MCCQNLHIVLWYTLVHSDTLAGKMYGTAGGGGDEWKSLSGMHVHFGICVFEHLAHRNFIFENIEHNYFQKVQHMQRCEKRQIWQIYLCYFFPAGANFWKYDADTSAISTGHWCY